VNKCIIPYTKAEQLIREGDVLLFRKESVFSFFVRVAGESPYSHVGLASWVFNELGERARLECVEFKEWVGGRAVSLRNYVEQNPGMIDVFTPNLYHMYTVFDCNTLERNAIKTYFNGRDVTNELRRLTGLPYGWSRIWDIIKRTFLPLTFGEFEDKKDEELIYPVCSTAIAYCYGKHFADLTHLTPHNRMEPGDIGRSPVLNYLFTLIPDPVLETELDIPSDPAKI
jgi:hypothetical protein